MFKHGSEPLSYKSREISDAGPAPSTTPPPRVPPPPRQPLCAGNTALTRLPLFPGRSGQEVRENRAGVSPNLRQETNQLS